MTSDKGPPRPAQARARAHERRVYLASHPFLYALTGLAARLGPIVSVPRVGHLVSSLALAKEVLSSPARFAKTGPGALSDGLSSVLGPSALVNMDGDGHRQLRARLQALFTPAYVTDLVQRVLAQPLQAVRDRLQRGERIDLVRVAQVITGRIACAILGVPLPPGGEEQACLDLHRAGSEFAAVLTLTGGRPNDARLAFARERFDALTRVARRAYEQGDDQCVPGRLRALGLDFEESRGVIGLLFLAGTETTASALPRIVALLIDSGQWPVLRGRRALMPGALDEGLRMTAAVPLMTRNVVAETHLGGRTLGQDDRVIVLLFQALRSEAMVSDPLDFDIQRSRPGTQGPTWFGLGPHFCLGAALARRELDAALSALLDAGDLAIVGRRYGSHSPLPGYGRLEVERCGPASPPSSMKL